MKTQVSINIPIWMILGIGVFVFIIMLLRINNKDNKMSKKIPKKNFDEENLDKEESSLNWIEKKDLLYWIIIICLGTISIFTFKYKTADEVIDHWGFAGTIISIILAVLAIIYTYYQSATTVDSTKRLERSTKKVQKATTRVEEATKDLENNNISNVMNEFEERLAAIIREMQKGIHDNITSNFEPLKSFINLQKENISRDKTIQILSVEEWKRYIDNAVVKNLRNEGITLLYACFLYENNLEYTIEGTKKWAKTVTNKEIQIEVFTTVIQAQMMLFASLNVLDFQVEGEKHNFTYVNETVLECIKEIVKEPTKDVKVALNFLTLAFDIEWNPN